MPVAPLKVGLPALSRRAFADGVVRVTTGATQSPALSEPPFAAAPEKLAPDAPMPA